MKHNLLLQVPSRRSPPRGASRMHAIAMLDRSGSEMRNAHRCRRSPQTSRLNIYADTRLCCCASMSQALSGQVAGTQQMTACSFYGATPQPFKNNRGVTRMHIQFQYSVRLGGVSTCKGGASAKRPLHPEARGRSRCSVGGSRRSPPPPHTSSVQAIRQIITPNECGDMAVQEAAGRQTHLLCLRLPATSRAA